MNRAQLVKALRDTAQSASNAIAGSVSGPVDLITAALRAGGLNIEKPIGGSEWMNEKGLTVPVEMGAPRIVGETLGMAGPAVVAAKAPQIASAINRGVQNLAAPTSLNRQAGVVKMPEYQGSHRPPMKGEGAPLHDLTVGGMYPADVYSPKGLRYYGTGEDALDRQVHRQVQAYRGNPDAPVKMYRAVPSSVPQDATIRHGDWVTTVRDYAVQHGEGALDGDYRIIEQMVPARKLFTNGDSWLEFGFDETGRADPRLLGLMGLGAAGGLGAYNYMQGQ